MVQNWAIETEKLRKDYPGVTAVSDVDLRIPTGVVHGFLGPNGAGKSTTLRMVCGLLRPTSGQVRLMGVDPHIEGNTGPGQVGWLPEVPPLYPEMAVAEFLSFAGKLQGMSREVLAPALDRVIEQTGLGHVRHRVIGNLSKGYRQRVGIAQALIHDPAVVVLDEPTAGLDPQSVVEIRALVLALKGYKTVVFSSHILHEVEAVCDTISIIDQGVLRVSGTLAEVKAKFRGGESYLLELGRAPTEVEFAGLRGLPYVASMTLDGCQLRVHPKGGDDVRGMLVRALVDQNFDVLALSRQGAGLEDVFIRLTHKGDV